MPGGLRLNDATLWLREGSDTFHGLRYSGGGSPFAGQNPDGPVLFGWAGGALGSREGGDQAVLSWKSSGNVGIGTNNPQSKLHVGGTPGVDGIRFPDGTLQTTAAAPLAPQVYSRKQSGQ